MLKWLFGHKIRKIMGNIKEEEDFDEYQSALQSMNKHMEDIEVRMKRAAKTQKALDKANRERNIKNGW